MLNKNFLVSAANLTTHNVLTIDTYLDIDIPGYTSTSTVRHYPKKIQFINKTGVDVAINIMSNDTELAKYTLDSTNYDLFTIQNNTTVVMSVLDILPTAYKILVQAPTGTASVDFRVECICYQSFR